MERIHGMIGPQRIVCLTEETTETLYLLGEQERIVGISAFTVRPPEAKQEKPVVSQFIKSDVAKILALDPDLVFGFSDLQADICSELISKGLDVYCFNQRSIAGILEMIRTLGRLVLCPEKGEALARELEGNIDRALAAAKKLPVRPRVFFEEWPDPIITGIRWVSEIIEIAGGEDCFPELRDMPLARDRIVTPDAVLAGKPDLYLASWCGRRFRRDTALARPGFPDSPMALEGRMVEIPSSVILQPGPACLSDGLAAVQEAISRVAVELASGGGSG